jgi:thiol-disulfide isomerase/thioredoxin
LYSPLHSKRVSKSDSVTVLSQVQIARTFLNGRVREKAIEQLVLRSFQYNTPEIICEMHSIALSDIKDTSSLALIELQYRQTSALFSGNNASVFTLKTCDGKNVSLTDFKGKVVYLDFWASWCGPCMMEMPSAKKLQDTFAKQDVVFLYVSVDDNLED